MEFHLPYFALRKAPSLTGSPAKARGKRLRDLKYLSFLKEDDSEKEGKETFILYQAQISCVVYGHSEWQWIMYALDDTGHTEHDHEEGDEGDVEGDLEETEEVEEDGEDGEDRSEERRVGKECLE